MGSTASLSTLDRTLAAALARAIVNELRAELSPINDERPERLTLAPGRIARGDEDREHHEHYNHVVI